MIFLLLRVKKVSFLIALIFGICIKFLVEFTTISLILPLLLSTTLLLSPLNDFEAN